MLPEGRTSGRAVVIPLLAVACRRTRKAVDLLLMLNANDENQYNKKREEMYRIIPLKEVVCIQ